MSDEKSNEPDERMAAEEDASEDLELSQDTADQVSGGKNLDKTTPLILP